MCRFGCASSVDAAAVIVAMRAKPVTSTVIVDLPNFTTPGGSPKRSVLPREVLMAKGYFPFSYTNTFPTFAILDATPQAKYHLFELYFSS